MSAREEELRVEEHVDYHAADLDAMGAAGECGEPDCDFDGVWAARSLAKWFLGDDGWADNILRAYKEPAWALGRVQAERDRYAK